MTNQAKVVAINYSAQVDRLGKLNALVAPHLDEIAAIKQELRESGHECVEGNIFRVTIGVTLTKAYTDWEKVARQGLPAAKLVHLIFKNTSLKEALGAVRVVAKVRSVK